MIDAVDIQFAATSVWNSVFALGLKNIKYIVRQKHLKRSDVLRQSGKIY
jgi:hypothetical protein